jgi:predicted transcriptional regulator
MEATVTVQSTDAFFEGLHELAKAIDEGQAIVPQFELNFETPQLMFKTITPRRWELLAALRVSGPTSIRALSLMLKRDYKSVHTDVAVLLDNNLVSKTEAGLIFVPWSRISTSLSFDQQAA